MGGAQLIRFPSSPRISTSRARVRFRPLQLWLHGEALSKLAVIHSIAHMTEH